MEQLKRSVLPHLPDDNGPNWKKLVTPKMLKAQSALHPYPLKRTPKKLVLTPKMIRSRSSAAKKTTRYEEDPAWGESPPSLTSESSDVEIEVVENDIEALSKKKRIRRPCSEKRTDQKCIHVSVTEQPVVPSTKEQVQAGNGETLLRRKRTASKGILAEKKQYITTASEPKDIAVKIPDNVAFKVMSNEEREAVLRMENGGKQDKRSSGGINSAEKSENETTSERAWPWEKLTMTREEIHAERNAIMEKYRLQMERLRAEERLEKIRRDNVDRERKELEKEVKDMLANSVMKTLDVFDAPEKERVRKELFAKRFHENQCSFKDLSVCRNISASAKNLTQRQWYSCFCGFIDKHYDNLVGHVSLFHRNWEPPHSCPVCREQYWHPVPLDQHLSRVHRIDLPIRWESGHNFLALENDPLE